MPQMARLWKYQSRRKKLVELFCMIKLGRKRLWFIGLGFVRKKKLAIANQFAMHPIIWTKKQTLPHRVRKLDFCEKDPRHGISGTKRRECTIEPGTGEYHCTHLCCNRGFQTLTTSSKKDCNCRYVWCCRVECEVCESVETKHYCNWFFSFFFLKL